MGAGEIIHELGSPIKDVLFPEAGLVSVLADVGEEEKVEVGKIGVEGVVGIWAIMPDPVSLQHSKVQVTGAALRLPAEVLRSAFAESALWREHCLRYANRLMVDAAQNAACNARHTLAARLARWLLEARDRLGEDSLPLTHSMVSAMLGVRRAGVTTAVGMLQNRKLIHCGRGQITIVDGPGLESAACSCYRIVNRTGARPLQPAVVVAAAHQQVYPQPNDQAYAPAGPA